MTRFQLTYFLAPFISKHSVSWASLLIGLGSNTGAADRHRAERCFVAAPAIVWGQDQNVLVDGDWVQVVLVLLSWDGTGTKAGTALGLPERPGDSVSVRVWPESTNTATSEIRHLSELLLFLLIQSFIHKFIHEFTHVQFHGDRDLLWMSPFPSVKLVISEENVSMVSHSAADSVSTSEWATHNALQHTWIYKITNKLQSWVLLNATISTIFTFFLHTYMYSRAFWASSACLKHRSVVSTFNLVWRVRTS